MVRIPEEYQEVEYIESPGLCYFDIIVPTNNSTVSSDIVFQPLTGGFKDNYWFAGDGRKQTIQHEYGTLGRRWYNDGSSATYIGNYSDVVHAYYHEYQRSGSVNIIWRMFGRYGFDSSQISNTPPCRIWSCYLVVDGKKAFALIPCYRKSDNEIGMYDTVSGTFYTNQGTGTFLKGNDVTYDPISLLETRRRILLNTPHIESASGNIVTFNTDLSANLPDMKIHFHPVQEGTGDPSPDNVRPISGWDGITITRCGKNLLDAENPDQDGFVFCYLPKGTKLTYSIEKGAVQIRYYRKDKTEIDYWTPIYTDEISNRKYRDFILLEDAYYWKTLISTSTKGLKLQLELSNSSNHPTSYEPYKGNLINIPFPQTIYGGYVDLIKGEIVNQWSHIFIDQNSPIGIFPWQGIKIDDKTGIQYTSALFKRTQENPRAILNCVPYCDKLPGGLSRNLNTCYMYDGDVYGACISLPTNLIGTTENELKTYLTNNNFDFVYQLRVPIIHSINPQTLKTLKGTNNIFSNANGNIQIKFWKH